MTKKNKKLIQKHPYYKHASDSIYIFYNTVFDFNMFINASSSDEAIKKFDQCGFIYREHWKIMLEINYQPTEIK